MQIIITTHTSTGCAAATPLDSLAGPGEVPTCDYCREDYHGATEAPAQTITHTTTSVYSLRVAVTAQEEDSASTQAMLNGLALSVVKAGAVYTDTHTATQDGQRYVSISYRIPNGDTRAITLAVLLLAEAGYLTADGLAGREAYLTTGLGANRRLLPCLSA